MAISTTGDEHRLGLLRRSVKHWDECLTTGDSLFVTVDGTEAEAERVRQAVFDWTGSVYRVGRPIYNSEPYRPDVDRLGVAVNKNTGLELLMDNTACEHLFLCDDDTWPLYRASLDKHINMADEAILHSMIGWGKHRLAEIRQDPNGFKWASWNWPRGVLLYQSRFAVSMMGGMVEAFGPGGHEHVEYSRRMHRGLLTPDDFCSPAVYAENGEAGPAMRASTLWHCEDMKRPGEPLGNHRQRRRELTSIRRRDGDWAKIEKIMRNMEDSAAFVDYHAEANGRASATLCEYTRAEEPEQA